MNKLIKLLSDFWYHPTIEEMQAQMLREVWHQQQHRRILPAFLFHVPRAEHVLSGIQTPTVIEMIDSVLGPLETMYADRNGDLHIKKYYPPTTSFVRHDASLPSTQT